MSGDDISYCRSQLTQCLKGNSNSNNTSNNETGNNKTVDQYHSLLRSWFTMSLTRDEFDKEARTLLPAKAIPLHNKFLIAILNRVNGLSLSLSRNNTHINANTNTHTNTNTYSSPDTSQGVMGNHSPSHSFSPFHNNDDNQHHPSQLIHNPPALTDIIHEIKDETDKDTRGRGECRWSGVELFLPDQGLVTARFLLTAWESGLDGVDDSSAELIVAATQVFLKNILSAVLTQRKAYKVRENNFVHNIGCEVPNMWLRNAPDQLENKPKNIEFDENDEEKLNSPLTVEDMEHSAAYDIACSVPRNLTPKGRVSLHDVYDALKVHRNVIASHSIYAINMERILTLLSHPGY